MYVAIDNTNLPTEQELPILVPKFDFVDTASRALGVDPWLVRSGRRFRQLTRVRWAMAHVMRDSYNKSYQEIGYALRRDHSTIYYGVKKSRELIKTDTRHAALVDMMVTCA